tara:strand:+ start:801 stop:1376 length:576 start_codon:yes stop_codon:yes gene_type:complete
MDILYYSNYCKHSQKIVQTLVKSNMQEKISFICIDKRKKDPRDNQTYITLENGAKILMPPNIHSVPALLLVKNNFMVLYGDDILQNFHNDMKENSSQIVKENGEPLGYDLFGSMTRSNIVSEKFTDYNMTAEELSSKSNSKSRNMHNYVSASESNIFINTPEENYKPDKISNEVTIDSLQQKRIDEIEKSI